MHKYHKFYVLKAQDSKIIDLSLGREIKISIKGIIMYLAKFLKKLIVLPRQLSRVCSFGVYKPLRISFVRKLHAGIVAMYMSGPQTFSPSKLMITLIRSLILRTSQLKRRS